MGRRKDKPRLIPEQDKRICRAICLCQLTMVLSCVSIVYLSVAIYSPSFKAFKSGFELDPVMCQTYNSQMPDSHCAWASCGEWCLTRTSGFCPQFHSIVRRNGTDIQLNNCNNNTGTVLCGKADVNVLQNFNCNNGSVCNKLSGVFSCSNGHCKNISQGFQCDDYHADGPTINSEKDNNKLNGFFQCAGVFCTKIKKPFSCDRKCSPITTSHLNVLLMHGDSVDWSNCETAEAFNEARGSEPGVRLSSPVEFWKEEDGVLLANCATVQKEGNKIIAKDCLNGTLLPDSIFPKRSMNFSQFWKIYENSVVEVDPEQRFLPNQHNLTIYKSKKLYINLEGCVNTLRGECKEFAGRHGSDGSNNTEQSRYECYYNKDPNVDFVTARYDLDKVYNELLFSLIVPVVLFVISSISLIVITKSVKVGDDAKMRCMLCAGEEDSDADEIYSARKSKRTRQKQVMEANENLDQLTKLEDHDISPANALGVGSTKSLLPLSPTNYSGTTENSNDDEKADKCDFPEKPLVVL